MIMNYFLLKTMLRNFLNNKSQISPILYLTFNMVRIFLIFFSFLCFINSANATWVVKELSDNQIAAYVKGENNLNNRMIFFFRKENCTKPAHYFVLNQTSEKDEVPVLINGTELKLPITKTGKTELGKDLIFLFKGYNLPDLFVNYYSKNDQVNLKIKNTNFEENFDVSSIQAVFDGAMKLCLE